MLPIQVLKLLNKFVRVQHFRMECLRSVITLMEKGEFLASIVIRDAYPHIPLCERLLLDHIHRLPDNRAQPYYHALITILLTRSWKVRKQCQQTIKKLLASLGGTKLLRGLLSELKVVQNSNKLVPVDS
ncbi:unnamed protein product [Ranitomeya imitator]|uniref:Uncharacterized protein n=1 Tax=Ranitomeya imitator TaxID=111125 RepID=A0ABN9MHR6_9NEOB|nr:unnamed protein product [Ranitomeya imitator]